MPHPAVQHTEKFFGYPAVKADVSHEHEQRNDGIVIGSHTGPRSRTQHIHARARTEQRRHACHTDHAHGNGHRHTQKKKRKQRDKAENAD